MAAVKPITRVIALCLARRAVADKTSQTASPGNALARISLTSRRIGAACFSDRRRAELIEHEAVTLVGQRVFAIALGYEDLNDHDELRHDPVMAVLAGKLEARRADCAPAASKSTLNRLELSQPSPSRSQDQLSRCRA